MAMSSGGHRSAGRKGGPASADPRRKLDVCLGAVADANLARRSCHQWDGAGLSLGNEDGVFRQTDAVFQSSWADSGFHRGEGYSVPRPMLGTGRASSSLHNRQIRTALPASLPVCQTY